MRVAAQFPAIRHEGQVDGVNALKTRRVAGLIFNCFDHNGCFRLTLADVGQFHFSILRRRENFPRGRMADKLHRARGISVGPAIPNRQHVTHFQRGKFNIARQLIDRRAERTKHIIRRQRGILCAGSADFFNHVVAVNNVQSGRTPPGDYSNRRRKFRFLCRAIFSCAARALKITRFAYQQPANLQAKFRMFERRPRAQRFQFRIHPRAQRFEIHRRLACVIRNADAAAENQFLRRQIMPFRKLSEDANVILEIFRDRIDVETLRARVNVKSSKIQILKFGSRASAASSVSSSIPTATDAVPC